MTEHKNSFSKLKKDLKLIKVSIEDIENSGVSEGTCLCYINTMIVLSVLLTKKLKGLFFEILFYS